MLYNDYFKKQRDANNEYFFSRTKSSVSRLGLLSPRVNRKEFRFNYLS